MEALSVDEIPTGKQWRYEPKWDGFRCLVFRDGGKIELQSKSGRSDDPVLPGTRGGRRLRLKPDHFVLDGEIAVPAGGAFPSMLFCSEFIRRRAAFANSPPRRPPCSSHSTSWWTPTGDRSSPSRSTSVVVRWRRFFAKYCRASRTIRLSPSSVALDEARRWLKRAGATLDGVIAKRRDVAYRSGERTGMQKIKNYRSADCVVGGFRYNEGQSVVGSLLLGLYDKGGLLHHVGFTSNIKQQDKAALTKKLKPLIAPPGFTGNAPGGPSRWSTKRSGEWTPLKPKLVVEVCYDHFTGDRFRHGTRMLRWRPDKAPRQCTLDQVKQKKARLITLLD